MLGFVDETVSSLPAKALKRAVLGSWDSIEALVVRGSCRAGVFGIRGRMWMRVRVGATPRPRPS